MSQRLPRLFVACFLLPIVPSMLGMAPLAADDEVAQTATRVVAVGDIHGAITGLEGLLRDVELTDEQNRWTATDVVLVQTGDMVDRGAGTRQVLDFMRRLESEAPAAGSQVRILLGNHEVMALTGDYRDVTPSIYGSFADDESEKRRKKALQEWRRWLGDTARLMGKAAPTIDKAARQKWLDEHPLGYIEYQEAFSPQGEYGRWLLEHQVATVLGDVLYQHAGISPEWATRSLDEINNEVRSLIVAWDTTRRELVDGGLVPATFNLLEVDSTLRYFQENPFPDPADAEKLMPLVERGLAGLAELLVLFREESPIWFRGYTKLPEEELAALFAVLEEAYGATRFVVGHTPTANRSIVERLGGRLFLIDAGMLTEIYGGRPAALEIVGERVTAIYPDERVLLYGE